MTWKHYAAAMLLFNCLGLLLLYALQRSQGILPLNPQNFPGVPPDLAWNTATSFITNTNWQAYSGEGTLSYFTQMIGLTVQNFLSAATGMALMVALIRGIARYQTTLLGNFWVDLIRGTLYIFLPLSVVFATLLASQGVIQNIKPYEVIQTLESQEAQSIPMGPAASQIAIKQLGSNGGGFFNANSAHPFENPNPLTNLLEMLAIILIPAASCYTYGLMVGDRRQGWAIFLAMAIILIPITYLTVFAEQQGNPAFETLSIDQKASGGNMEGKETRHGVVSSGIWATVTTATGNGSVNSMLDSFLPISGLMPLWLIELGEVVFGGVGSGMYGMIMLVLITVFISGLMVGRTPEYLGKKIEVFEMKMAALAVLLMPMTVLTLTAISVVTPFGTQSMFNPEVHGFSEVLYAFSSMTNNNGSALAGLNANTPYYNIAGGFAMLIGRFWIVITILAVAGSLAKKKTVPGSLGTLPTHTPMFIMLLIGVTLIFGALTFFPALALGPIAEQLMLGSKYAN